MTEKSCLNCASEGVCVWNIQVEKWFHGLNWEFTRTDGIRVIDSSLRKDIYKVIGEHCKWYKKM